MTKTEEKMLSNGKNHCKEPVHLIPCKSPVLISKARSSPSSAPKVRGASVIVVKNRAFAKIIILLEMAGSIK